jgi:hypothetical protein
LEPKFLKIFPPVDLKLAFQMAGKRVGIKDIRNDGKSNKIMVYED